MCHARFFLRVLLIFLLHDGVFGWILFPFLVFGLYFDEVFFFLSSAAGLESLHLLSELADSAKFEGFPKKPLVQSVLDSQPSPEPWLNRLRDHKAFWSTFYTSLFVINVLTVGYMLPWINGPPPGPFVQKNHPSAFEFLKFVSEAVASLVVTGAASKVYERPWIVVSPLVQVVPKGIDKLKLILDLRYVNSFLRIDPFKYESLKAIFHLCKLQQDLLFSVDLKFGYHHVDIDPDY
jgi:hypothetical protein